MSSLERINVDLSAELSGFDGQHDLGAGNWIVFDYVPSDVVVQVAFDNNSNSRLTVKQGMKIRATHGSVYLWSTGTSAEMMSVVHWSAEDMEIVYPPSSDFDSLNNLGAGALASLDKIFNPYEEAVTTLGTTTSSSNLTILSKVLTCDKITISLNILRISSVASFGNGCAIGALIDGINVFKAWQYYHTTNWFIDTDNGTITIENVKGKTLSIISDSNSSNDSMSYCIQEYTLKT